MKVSKITYVILAFFLGGLGLHKFYTKRKGLGFLFLLFCWTGIPGVIGMVEGVIAALKTPDENGNIII